jgi:hypothetical protein
VLLKMERLPVMWYVRNVAPKALLGAVAGMAALAVVVAAIA